MPKNDPSPRLSRWQTVLGILRDTLQLCDAVNLSTAMHKLGKLFRHNHEAVSWGGRVSV